MNTSHTTIVTFKPVLVDLLGPDHKTGTPPKGTVHEKDAY